MPLVSRLFLKFGLIYFLLALAAGFWMEISIHHAGWMLPLFWHTLMLGWITQIIMGVSHWMFPGRSREENFAGEKWMWFTLIFLNTGLLLRLIAEPLVASGTGKIWSDLLVLSALLQWTGGLTYIVEIWPRVMSKKQQILQRKKQRSEKR